MTNLVIPHLFFDYSPFDIVSYSFDDIIVKLKKCLKNDHILNNTEVNKLKKYFYNNSYDGRIKYNLNQKLNQIYSDNFNIN